MTALGAAAMGAGLVSTRPSAWSRKAWWTGREPVQALGSIEALLSAIGTAWIVCLMLLVCADVVGRAFLNHPLPRVPEIVGHSIVAIVFLQLASTLRRRRLTRADVLFDRLAVHRPIAAAFYQAVFHLAGACVFGLMAWGVAPEALEAFTDGDYFGQQGGLTVPTWPFMAIALLGSVVTGAEFLVQAGHDVWRILVDEPDHIEARQGAPRGWGAMAALVGLVVAGLAGLSPEMDPLAVGLALLVAMLVLILIGMHIGVALILLSLIGTWLIRGDVQVAIDLLARAASGVIQDQLFGVVPLFVLMGLLVDLGNIGRDTFSVCQWLLGRIKGGLGVATVAANAVFAAVTGVSIASAVVFTKVAVPPMINHGYTARFAVGVVAGSSVLGMLIPPSLLLIVFGILAEASIGALFAAAVVPGLLLACAFGVAIVVMADRWPAFVGRVHTPDTRQLPSAWSREPPQVETPASAALKLAPIVALIAAVFGGIYGGYFSPTEAGAVGAFLALVIVGVKALVSPGMVTRERAWKVLADTGSISVSILFLIIAANMYTRMIALSGLPNEMIGLITGADLGFYGILTVYLLIVLVLGMVLDSVSIMLITLPLILPIMATFETDMIWFGIITVIAVEVGLLTPPLGLSVYAVKAALGNTQVTLGEIFTGAFPFVLVMIAVLALLVAFPELTEISR